MICTKCNCECTGFPTGNPEEDVCSDCAFPVLTDAIKAANKAVEESHRKQTGEAKTAGEIMRGVIGIKTQPDTTLKEIETELRQAAEKLEKMRRKKP